MNLVQQTRMPVKTAAPSATSAQIIQKRTALAPRRSTAVYATKDLFAWTMPAWFARLAQPWCRTILEPPLQPGQPWDLSNVKGQPACLPCPADTYNINAGSTASAQCTKCTDFALSTTTNGSVGVPNATGCMCRPNFYHHISPSNSEDYCLQCPTGGVCPEVGTGRIRSLKRGTGGLHNIRPPSIPVLYQTRALEAQLQRHQTISA